jgi:hypothetical protein
MSDSGTVRPRLCVTLFRSRNGLIRGFCNIRQGEHIMEIQSTCAALPQTSNPRQASAGSQFGALVANEPSPQQGGQAAASGQSASMSMSMSMTSASSSVESMLGQVDSQLGSDEMLKMAITMLILEALLGKDQGGMAQESMLMGLRGSQGSSSSSNTSASMSSQSFSPEIGYAASSTSSADGSGGSSGQDPASGGRLDTQP